MTPPLENLPAKPLPHEVILYLSASTGEVVRVRTHVVPAPMHGKAPLVAGFILQKREKSGRS